MSSKKNSDKETFSLPKTVSFFGTQKSFTKNWWTCVVKKQYNEANKEWLLTPITLAEGGLRKCGYFMQ